MIMQFTWKNWLSSRGWFQGWLPLRRLRCPPWGPELWGPLWLFSMRSRLRKPKEFWSVSPSPVLSLATRLCVPPCLCVSGFACWGAPFAAESHGVERDNLRAQPTSCFGRATNTCRASPLLVKAGLQDAVGGLSDGGATLTAVLF